MGATFSRVKTWISGEILTAANLNAEFDNILNNLDPTGVDDESSNVAGMQSTADPGEVGTESLATSLKGELQRLRFAVNEIKNTTHWYESPANALDGLLDLDGNNTVSGDNTLSGANLFSGVATFSAAPVLQGAAWPSFHVTNSSNQNITVATSTKVEWDTETFDTNSDFDSTTNYRFTPTVAGKYLLNVNVTLQDVTSGELVTIFITDETGSTILALMQEQVGSTGRLTLSLTTIVDANGSSDGFEVYIDSTSDTNYNVDNTSTGATSFAGSRIG